MDAIKPPHKPMENLLYLLLVLVIIGQIVLGFIAWGNMRQSQHNWDAIGEAKSLLDKTAPTLWTHTDMLKWCVDQAVPLDCSTIGNSGTQDVH